jgi:putative membrane protein
LQLYLIGGLIFSFLVAIFALWNSTEIIIRFPFLGEFTTSQALVIIGSATLGALITMIFSLIKNFKLNFQIKKQTKTIRDYEQIIDKMKKQIEEKEMEEKNSQTQSIEVPADPLQ